MRHLKKEIQIGNTKIGGNNRVLVQSMLNVKSDDIEGNVKQAIALEKEGCQILRVSVPRLEDVRLVEAIKGSISIPLVADIHFDYKIALACVDAGIDKIRINPGNIGDDARVMQVAKACNTKNIPIRIGVNAGSLEKNILQKYGAPTPQALCESALYHIGLLEKCDFDNIVVSIKSSNVKTMIDAYTLLDTNCSYSLHLGVTEAGTYRAGIIKSAMGIGNLLMSGIGDTIRVSLTDTPINEIAPGFDILRAAGHTVEGPEIISCPTCGRTNLDIAKIAKEVEKRLKGVDKPIKIAVMGCAVNGPGEAREADIGIACGVNNAILFKKGKQIKVLEGNFIDEFISDIMVCIKEIN